ncbi:hypothetical protein GGI20_002764 [Coemansia sp. BCRC 34301]|nr:hypothetical protein GGI20_002764 [Coemansia sp. BCRC 34301]
MDNSRHCNPILCLAPNAAYQTTLLFSHFGQGQVNRALKQANSLGGKGQNFTVASLGFTASADRLTLLQILGGSTATLIEALEHDLHIDYVTVRTPQQTRSCTTCIDSSSGSITELVGTSDAIAPEAAAEFEAMALYLLQPKCSPPPRALALCGSFPPGLDPDSVARIVSAAKSTGRTMVFVDAAKDIHPVLATKCIDVLKINSAEAASLASACDSPNTAQIATHLAHRYSIGVVAVTDGPGAAYLADLRNDACYELRVPDLLEEGNEHFVGMLNPIGAGDTCSAVMVNALIDGVEAVDAFALGLAAASASCLVLMPNCVFDINVMSRIRSKITIAKL